EDHVTARTVQNQICQYFGGPYDQSTRSYRTPQIPGLGVTRRAFPKREDEAEYYLGMPPGIGNGCVMVVWLLDGDERRIAVAGATDDSVGDSAWLRGEGEFQSL